MSDARDFEARKADHIRLSLKPESQALGRTGLERISLVHEAIPNFNFQEVSLRQIVLRKSRANPLMISSMTAGHAKAHSINSRLAKAASDRGWIMGVGSQRRQLFDSGAAEEWRELRRIVPGAELMANLGLTQVIQTSTDDILRIIDSIGATALIVHTNPLQECLQTEGTPNFKGAYEQLSRVCSEIKVPVILKETGCGFSQATLERLKEVGVQAVDVSGLGGTHWGRIEGARAGEGSLQRLASETFANWGLSTMESLFNAESVKPNYEIWASGGLRNGLDAAKCLALGAKVVGFAQPALKAAMESEEALSMWMQQVEFELRVAMFCSGVQNLGEMRERKVWQWQNQ